MYLVDIFKIIPFDIPIVIQNVGEYRTINNQLFVGYVNEIFHDEELYKRLKYYIVCGIKPILGKLEISVY